MTTSNDWHGWLSAPARISALSKAVRSKIPAADVEDVVQATLTDALTARERPTDPSTFDRWLVGIARHKIADYYRQPRRREILDSDVVAGSTCSELPPDGAADLLRWVDRELPDEPEATRTLEWMLREADGDPLESIAKEHDIAAPTVRQRVSRLRRYFRERWAMQVAAALGLLVVVTGLLAYRQRYHRSTVLPDPASIPTTTAQAAALRRSALAACRDGQWTPCVSGLDRAKVLDPAGDNAGEVQAARLGASRALAPTLPLSPTAAPPAPIPPTTPSVTPTNDAPSKHTTPHVNTKLPRSPKQFSPASDDLTPDKQPPTQTQNATQFAKKPASKAESRASLNTRTQSKTAPALKSKAMTKAPPTPWGD